MTPELQQFDQSARAYLSGAEFTRDFGSNLASTIAQVTRQTQAMTPDQLESYRLIEYEKLQRVYGDTLDEKLRAVDDMIDRIEHQRPELKDFRDAVLGTKGVGRNAMIWHMLIGQSEIYWARRKGR